MKKEFCSVTLKELETYLLEKGEQKFRAKQLLSWFYEKRIGDWDEMTNVSKSLRERLKEDFTFSLDEKERVTSHDQETIKFLWQLQDKKLVESVLILSDKRRTVCVSSQVGCPARCAFCASGKEGLIRNLTTAEIVEQVWRIDRFLKEKEERVTHIVFMGMGEPLENYEAVVEAVRMLIDPNIMGLSQRRITISTVGVIPGIDRLKDEEFRVNLVLSLHAPNQELRKKIIPFARKFSLLDILQAMGRYHLKTKRDITYEYTLIENINDQLSHAEELATLLKGQQCTVNLIPYNPILGIKLQRPSKDQVEAFRDHLLKREINTTWRFTKGKDIAAACGQLALRNEF